jgi:catechol 2,3-dioxygenase-like lactoylglutathione lyase family enzyme
MITGAHLIVESSDPEADRAFIRDVLGFDSVDAGGGWPIFALPPAELAVHPGSDGEHQLYLMCANIEETLRELQGRGVAITKPVSDQRWGRIASIALPGGGELPIYEPKHPRPVHRRSS